MRFATRVVGAVIVGASLLAAAPAASAATFSVNPTQIFLGGRTTSALLTLRNESEEMLRFQLTAFAWDQSVAGEIELAATQDVVFFPALLTLKPGEERKIRIGSTVASGAVEKTYRIFVEELPPGVTANDATAVRVLTKMGIPIFVQPIKQSADAALNALGMRDGSLHFTVSNTGTVHFVPRDIKVRGVGANGEQLFEQQLTAWYILPGGRRDFDMAIAAADCGRTASLVVEVGLGQTALKESLQTPGGACGR
jgi:fimbrial chaperone protein